MKKINRSAWHVLIIHFENILLLQKYPLFECLSVLLHGNCKILLCNYVHVSSKLLISGVIILLAHTKRTWQARVHCIIKFPLLCLFENRQFPYDILCVYIQYGFTMHLKIRYTCIFIMSEKYYCIFRIYTLKMLIIYLCMIFCSQCTMVLSLLYMLP